MIVTIILSPALLTNIVSDVTAQLSTSDKTINISSSLMAPITISDEYGGNGQSIVQISDGDYYVADAIDAHISISSSVDGRDWTKPTLAAYVSNNNFWPFWPKLVEGPNNEIELFFQLKDSGTSHNVIGWMHTSSNDGIDWSDATLINVDIYYKGNIIYTQDKDYMTFTNSRGSQSQNNQPLSSIYSSIDGINWTIIQNVNFYIEQIVASPNGTFTALGYTKNNVFMSFALDANNKWSKKATIHNIYNSVMIESNNLGFALVGMHLPEEQNSFTRPELRIQISTDLINWSVPNIIVERVNPHSDVSIIQNKNNSDLLLIYGIEPLNLIIFNESNLIIVPNDNENNPSQNNSEWQIIAIPLLVGAVIVVAIIIIKNNRKKRLSSSTNKNGIYNSQKELFNK
jgi:hypothetical protein